MRSEREGKKRRVFNSYNLLVLLCLVVICGAGYILLEKQGVDVASYLPINEIKDIFSSKEVEVASEEENAKENKTANQGITVAKSTPDVQNTGVSTRSIEETTPTPIPTPADSGISTQSAGSEISETEAKRIALAKFQTLGETDTKEDELEIMKIKRKEDMFYYVSSKNNNTIEIKIADGTIARVNGVTQ